MKYTRWVVQAYDHEGENRSLVDCVELDFMLDQDAGEADVLALAREKVTKRSYRVARVIEYDPVLEHQDGRRAPQERCEPAGGVRIIDGPVPQERLDMWKPSLVGIEPNHADGKRLLPWGKKD